ncbi:MAG: transcription-repair coupling factor [Lachnospiraceae bacterium]|nr:transcription-repair coupling factor [Lachnospiraceae bacterium]
MGKEMEALLAPLEEITAYRTAKEYIDKAQFPLQISGCVESQKCQWIYGLTDTKKWKVIITANEMRARELVEDYRMFDKQVYYYPAKDVIFFSADIHGNAVSLERLKVREALAKGEGGTIITTLDAGMESVISQSVYDQAKRTIAEGSLVELDQLIADLTNMGYTRQTQVETPGEFSVRGGIIDVFPVAEDSPYRIELWGDEVDTIRSFDAESQRSIERVEELCIFTASEMILTGEQIEKGLQAIEKDGKKVSKQLMADKKFEASNRLNDHLRELRENYEAMQERMGMESYLLYFPVEVQYFFEAFPAEDTIFFLDEPSRCMEKAETVEIEFRESMQSRLEQGYSLPKQMEILCGGAQTLGWLMNQSLVVLSILDTLPKQLKISRKVNIQVQPVGTYNKHFEILVDDMKRWRKNGYRVILLSSSRTRAKRLSDSLNEYDIPAFYREVPDEPLESGQVMVAYGYLRHGFSYGMIKFAVVTEGDIFGAKQAKKKRKQKKYDGKSIQSFNELSVGDYVVHENHGLGVYKGIEKITVDRVTKDYLKVEYGDGGNLYVPVSGLDVLQKYAGQEAKAPKLNKLNSKEWKKTKAKVRGAVQEIAKDLVMLYAKRQEQKGYAFGPDTVWQQEFEELFPFEETNDQLAAIAATKKDMESDKIMDRLICGDVGYGKTEIALRAAFKAVNDGKQVAILVPTTILAQQHYNTLMERLGDFPVRVEMLSRFRTPAQQKKAITLLKKGQVDIVIGTHRLLSKDVTFKDLGLLIVDEEQRFGVTHKEKIKQMKGNVDVLTLSATPIPRTLHMSLVGIRDMSVLEEPPVDRLPIQTFVMEHNDEIIREAINRELARDGQVYMVYNRVQHIDEVAAEIGKLVPDATVAFAHGQMSERELENIMMAFISHEIDVLVATTIIETGLDISNVNTIIIDHADRMGLSQLYQLRGRVGRSNRTAYAFLMYQKGRMLKEVAEKRLSAIREYTELGSGIKVAMRDLEIRGAGNLLGAAQSGHMQAVGYDLYCKMLNEAVRSLKGEETEEESFETSIDLQVDAYIPASYIRSEYQKLDMYKRFAGIETPEEYEDMQEELVDRFGEIPKAAENLLRVALLKAEAHRAGITQIVQKPNGIRIYLKEHADISSEKLMEMLKSYAGKLKVVQGATEADTSYFLYQIKQDKKQPAKRYQTGYTRSLLQTTQKNSSKKGTTSDAQELFQTVSQVIRSIGECTKKGN